MAEIPSWMWIFSGILITGFSVFMGYIRPVEYFAFFRIMLWVGLIMVVFGLIKFKLSQKTREDMLDEMRRRQHQRGQSEYELRQMQNTGYQNGYQNNQYKQPVQRQGMQSHNTIQRTNNMHGQHPNHTHQTHSHTVHSQHSHAHPQNAVHPHNTSHNLTDSRQHYSYPAKQNPNAQKSNARFCHQCGTPLLNIHKFCPMCGARV